jgi:hypothetical protein
LYNLEIMFKSSIKSTFILGGKSIALVTNNFFLQLSKKRDIYASLSVEVQELF